MKDLTYILNELLTKVRVELGYTQYEMAEKLNCSQELISKIENKKRELSFDLIYALADISKMDFHYYRYISSKFVDKEEYLAFCELARLINTDNLKNIDKLEEKLVELEAINTFNNGEAYALVSYCHVVISYYKYEDYEEVVDRCITTLGWNEEAIINNKVITLKSSYYYGIYSLLIKANIELEKLETAHKLCMKFFNHVQCVWGEEEFKLSTDTYFYRKSYLSLYVDYITVCFEQNELSRVLSLCEVALDKCSELNILQPMKFILSLKVQALCKLNKIEEAKCTYNELEVICKYSNQKETFVEVFSTLNKLYPFIKA